MTNSLTTSACHEQLEALADYLCGRQESIIAQCRASTNAMTDLTIISTLTRRQFSDHIPGIIDAYARALRAWPEKPGPADQMNEIEQVSGHGLQRWQQGYQLRELTLEWGQLLIGIMEELENYAIEHSELVPEVMPAARRLLTRLCCDGSTDSANRYWQLHQSESAGHVRDLERALETLGEIENARAVAWREAAHDLRGSVTVVKGATSMLQHEDLGDAERALFSDMLQRSVSSLHEMLTELMTLSRLEAGEETRSLDHFDAAELLIQICEASQALAVARGLSLRTDGPKSLMVQGDRGKIQRILQNLLLNAIKYTRQGGVVVSWQEGTVPEKTWSFSVTDTGPGLDTGPGAPLAHRLYDATQAGHEAEEPGSSGAPLTESFSGPAMQQSGEGVGLSIVKRLCELLEASLELETETGQGSTFKVSLPRRYDEDDR